MHTYTPTRLLACAFAASLILGALTAQPQIGGDPDWTQFNSLLVSDISSPEVLSTLFGEKDLAVWDVDNDGDMDVVVARMESFKDSLGAEQWKKLPNLLLLNIGGSLVDHTDDYTNFKTITASPTRDAKSLT